LKKLLFIIISFSALEMKVRSTIHSGVRKVINFFSSHQTERKLNLADIMRFLNNARTHPIIGHRFKDLTDARMLQIGERMFALLTYAFNYDRIHPFKGLFDMH